METEVSLDNLTIMAYITGGTVSYLNSLRNIDFDHLGSRKNKGTPVDVFKGKDGSTYIEVSRDKARIEFNPNTANMEAVGTFLETLKHPRLTRMDIAIDYFGVNLGRDDLDWTSIKRRKYRKFLDEDKRLETLYIGAQSSDRQYRIYNKKLEREAKDSPLDPRAVNGHWRVEIQERYTENETAGYFPEDYFAEDFFRDIMLHKKDIDVSSITDTGTMAYVLAILHNPSFATRLSKNARPKYKKIINELKASQVLTIPQPVDIYRQEKDRLVGQLDGLFKKTLVVFS